MITLTDETRALLRATMREVQNNMELDHVSDMICDLYFRWQDEKEHEDIKEYGKVIQKLMIPGSTVVDTAKRPFGFIIERGLFRFHWFTRPNGTTRIECKGYAVNKSPIV